MSTSRSSGGESVRDEAYWEKRRRNNDAAKRSREKRRMNDMAMEQRLIELAKENSLLKSRLTQQQRQQQQPTSQPSSLQVHAQNILTTTVPHDSVIVSAPRFDTPSLPAPSMTAFTEFAVHPTNGPPSKLPAVFPAHLFARTPLISSSATVSQATNSQQLPVLQICHLQASLQSQQVDIFEFIDHCDFDIFSKLREYRTPSTTLISSGRGAFQPFHSSRDSSLGSASTQRISPDSSTSEPVPIDYSNHVIEKCGIDKPISLLGSLLSTRRTSPLVPQSCTDIHSGLSNTRQGDNDLKNCLSSLAVNLTTTKSDSDSMGSPSSNHSTSDSTHSQPSPASSGAKNSAIVKALNSRPSTKQQYMDRRRRNNEAAKRCRANRRAQFEMRSKRAQQLELENGELRKEMTRLKQELEQLKAIHAAKTVALQR
uniref:BZIP domain-containing protein n=1 Tax=Parascaris equorum TaxID=6256 RepID=A0A914RUE7_PAREQ